MDRGWLYYASRVVSDKENRARKSSEVSREGAKKKEKKEEEEEEEEEEDSQPLQ